MRGLTGGLGCAVAHSSKIKNIADKVAVSENIEVLKKWPGSGSLPADKTPSILSYDPNDSAKVMAWGHSVTPAHKVQYANFKYLLVPPQEFESKDRKWELSTATGATLPEGKTAQDLCVDYLRQVRGYVQGFLENTYGERFLASQDVIYVFTVPAAWSDRSKALILKVAEEAGFKGSVNLVSESEAAAIYCATLCDEGELRVGSKFLGIKSPSSNSPLPINLRLLRLTLVQSVTRAAEPSI